MKKLLWILGGLFVMVLVAILSVPLFVDVDQYRPMIVKEANRRINGQLELGKLKLSLWGAIKIHADSIKVSVNGFPEPLVSTQQFHLEIPYSSVLGGSPQVTAVLEAPKISVMKDKFGRMNATELLKVPGASTQAPPAAKPEEVASDMVTSTSASTKKKAAAPAHNEKAPLPPPAPETASRHAAGPVPPPGTAPQAPLAPASPAAPTEPAQVPKLIAGARLGLRIQNGDLTYLDRLTKSDYRVIGLDVNAKNLGLGSTMTIQVKAPVKGESPTMTFEGPLTADAEIKPVLVGTNVKSVSGKVDLDATKLKVDMKGGAFRKTESMTLTARAVFEGSEAETLLRGLDVQFADFKVHGKGRVTMEPVTAKVNISTDPGTVRLEKVQTFVPLAEPYQLKGLADFNADVDWKPDAIRVNGDVKVSDGSFFLKDVLKAPLGFKVQAGFSESSLNVTRAALSGPESDMELTGNVKNFLAPQFAFAITGKSFNVDKTLVLPPPGGAAPAKTTWISLVQEAYAEAPAGELNPMLAMAKNPMILGAGGTLSAQLGKVTVYNAVLEQVSARAQLQNLLLKVNEASLRTFGGTVKTSGEFDLKAPGLNYHSQGNVAGISAKEALSTYFPKYKNTLEGSTDATWNVSGLAFPASLRMRNVKGTAKILAKDGALKTVDVQDTINGALGKVSFLKGKQVKLDDGFKTLSADVKMEGGVVRVDPIDVQPRGRGVVIKGKSTIQENLDQETYLDVFDPQNVLPQELHAGGKPVLPLHINGQLSRPNVDYGYTLQRVATTAGTNVLKDQALKALGVPNTPGMSDQEKLKKAAEELKKKFHF